MKVLHVNHVLGLCSLDRINNKNKLYPQCLNSSGVSAPQRKKSQCGDELGGDASLLCMGDHLCDLYVMNF